MRGSETAVWLFALALGVGLAASIVVGMDWAGIAVVLLAIVAFVIVAQMITTPQDEAWLPKYVLVGFIAKMVGATLRYGVFEVIYLRQGDAAQYHAIGARLAPLWRNFQIPSLDVGGSTGTRLVEVITGLLYAPYTPDIFTGFLMFASVAFIGQLFFYAAFRRALPDARLKVYAFAILFVPSLVFWPSSIGKDALMLLFIGFSSYAVVRLLENYEIKWLALFSLGAFAAASIRPHVGALLLVSFSGAAFLTKAPSLWRVRFRKVTMLSIGGLAAIFAMTVFADRFGLTPDDLQLNVLIDELARRTGSGGSAVAGSAILSIGDVPQGLLRVVFRPLLYEVFGPVGLASSLEGTLLLAVMLWKLPAMLRNFRKVRAYPFVMFSLVYFAGFVVLFSPILNLGILARQRTQVTPLLLVFLIALGWKWKAKEEASEPEPATVAAP